MRNYSFKIGEDVFNGIVEEIDLYAHGHVEFINIISVREVIDILMFETPFFRLVNAVEKRYDTQ